LDAHSLLHRQVIIKSLKLNDAVINLVSDPVEGWNFENSIPSKTAEKVSPGGSHTSFWGVISEVEIEGGQLVASYLLPSNEPGIIIFEARNVSCKLEQVDLGAFMDPSSSSFAAQGDLKADSVRFVSIQGTNVKSKLRLKAKQVFSLTAAWKLMADVAPATSPLTWRDETPASAQTPKWTALTWPISSRHSPRPAER